MPLESTDLSAPASGVGPEASPAPPQTSSTRGGAPGPVWGGQLRTGPARESPSGPLRSGLKAHKGFWPGAPLFKATITNYWRSWGHSGAGVGPLPGRLAAWWLVAGVGLASRKGADAAKQPARALQRVAL